MLITQIEYKDLPPEIRNEIADNKIFKYYKLSDMRDIYYVVYDNIFHTNNQYLYPIKQTFNNLNKTRIKAIKTHLNKPLQVMLESTETDIINNLLKLGFILKRETFEREFKKEDLIIHDYKQVDVKSFTRNSQEFEKIAKYAFDYYLETHQDINAFTGTFSDFVTIIPNKVIYQEENKKVKNLVFIDENELCYITSNDKNSFIDFALTVINKMFNEFESIMFEFDSTDKVAMILKKLFKENSNKTYKTFIF
ncbi:MAG TPA: hypothetical protein PLR16_02605 [Bacilli bacterium]|nr:MAG: hypothetical protein BWY97_01333 [Tenericutes bacterium ADurb.BinA124]HNZ50025.1 hypothetical protein [Bacilli bacterium]HPX84159.1 hypothetical protein [Bacilli bacterium]